MIYGVYGIRGIPGNKQFDQKRVGWWFQIPPLTSPNRMDNLLTSSVPASRTNDDPVGKATVSFGRCQWSPPAPSPTPIAERAKVLEPPTKVAGVYWPQI